MVPMVLLVLFVCACATGTTSTQFKPNVRPVIGVLAQETFSEEESLANSDNDHAITRNHGDSYIRSAYFKFVQQSGALAVPIKINQTTEYYIDIFSKINGVVFPGGAVSITESGYAKAGKILYNLAIDANKKGDYFPILGICLGFELLTALTSGHNLMTKCDAENLPLRLNFTKNASDSRLFQDLPLDLETGMKDKPVTYNFHQNCLTLNDFNTKAFGLNAFYRVMSTNRDRRYLDFVSTFEAHDFPFYGVQWHPEKNVYFWDTTAAIQHSALAVEVSHYMSDFFVNEGRKSFHHFPDHVSEASALIDNYASVFMGAPSFVNMYYFNTTGC